MAARVIRLVPLHFEALRLLVSARILLRTKGLTPAIQRLAKPRTRRPETPERLLRTTQRVGAAVPGSACLVQAVTLAALLTRRGERCAVVIGGERAGGSWGAHAWVETATMRLQPVPGPHEMPLARCESASDWRLTPIARPAPTPQ